MRSSARCKVGEAQIGERLLSAHANENAVFGYDSVPFLATSFAASDKLRDAARPTLNALLNEQNMTLLYSVPWPPQGFYTNKEVNSLADAAGLKFRAYNAATARVAELAGMVPIQIEASELKQALATGVVEAFISSGSTGVDEKVWEDLTNFYDAKGWLPRNSIFVNSDAFNALPAASQECLTSISRRGRSTRVGQGRRVGRWVLENAGRKWLDRVRTRRATGSRFGSDRGHDDRRMAGQCG